MEKQKGKKGSILVLTILSVLILSLIVTGLLSVGTTEIHSTQNFHLNKSAYYASLEGVEGIRVSIADNPDVGFVGSISKSPSETEKMESFDGGDEDREFKNLGIRRSYITGNLKDFKDNTPQLVTKFEGFDAPQFRGLALGTEASIVPVVWRVQITAEAGMGGRVGYAEIIAGVYAGIVVD